MKNLFISILLLSIGPALWANPVNFPSSWWKTVERSQAKWWEVLPQDAKKGEVVLSKRNELGILSNFAETPFEFEGKKYRSVEGLWQSMKYPETMDSKNKIWKHSRAEVEQMIGFEAKKAGSLASKYMKEKKINLVTYKGREMIYKTSEKGDHYKLIKRIMWAKVTQNKRVKDILLKTKGLVLIPDHKVKKDAPPAWKYNQIWMEIRSDLHGQNTK